jgi:tRNA threonylcarbamoyladenosine biosynthesis protein TsaB
MQGAKILAYDTSGEILSIGVFENETVLASYESTSESRHSATLMPGIERVLKQAKVDAKTLDCVAVGLGPGSFTGLRIGVTTAKVLAYTLGCRLVGVSSIEAQAHWHAGPGRIAILKDARKGMFYAAIYENKNNVLREVFKPTLISAESFLGELKKGDAVSGDATDLYREKLEARGLTIFRFQSPGAAQVAKAAFILMEKKKFADPFMLEPLYLHPRDCNVTKKRDK